MKLADDCFFHDKDRMPHDEALAVLKSRVRPVVDVESIDLHVAQGRYLAESVLAPRDIPAHDNAAVDGYAFSHSAYDRQAGARLKIVGEAAAGHPYPTYLAAGGLFRARELPLWRTEFRLGRQGIGRCEVCAAWAAPVFLPGANGRSCGPIPGRD